MNSKKNRKSRNNIKVGNLGKVGKVENLGKVGKVKK